MQDDCPFLLLPEELVRMIYSFADIPSLSAVAQTNKNKIFQYAMDDKTWSDFVERRFRVRTSRSHPRFYGGPTWKDAYRTLSFCNRIPKTRYSTKSKVVFAKGGGGTLSSSVSVWALVSHTENCKTRIVRDSNLTADRFIVLQICIQNTSSRGQQVSVDATRSFVQMGSADVGHSCKWAVDTGSLRPNILVHPTETSSRDVQSAPCDVRLGSFEFTIISIHFPCDADMVFETDFLSRAVAICVPFKVISASMRREEDSWYGYLPRQESQARASFISENELWNHYTQLPGRCLSLTDKYRLALA